MSCWDLSALAAWLQTLSQKHHWVPFDRELRGAALGSSTRDQLGTVRTVCVEGDPGVTWSPSPRSLGLGCYVLHLPRELGLESRCGEDTAHMDALTHGLLGSRLRVTVGVFVGCTLSPPFQSPLCFLPAKS